MVRLHVQVEHLSAAHVHRGIIQAAVRGAVKGIVLHAGEQLVLFSGESSLETADIGAGEIGPQQGILTGAFHDTSPARVVRNVHHGRIGPVHALGGRLPGRYTGAEGGILRIPGGGDAQRRGEDGPEAVHHVQAHQQGDVQRRRIHGELLQGTHLVGALHVQDRADTAFPQQRLYVRFDNRSCHHIAPYRRQVHLADLLFQGHPAHQFIDKAVFFILRAGLRGHYKRNKGKQFPHNCEN